MGKTKRDLDNTKIFLGNMTEKEFYETLEFNRGNIYNGRMNK